MKENNIIKNNEFFSNYKYKNWIIILLIVLKNYVNYVKRKKKKKLIKYSKKKI